MKLSAEKPHHVFKDICLLKKLSLNRKDQMTAVIESVTEARCLSVLFLFPREGVFSLTSYKIAVIDGQGGGIGRHITAALREALNEEVKIYALGTNAIAMGNILKGGANEAACGENAIIQTAGKVDLIVGSLAILISGSMCGEVTAKIVDAVGNARAAKILLPINRNRVTIINVNEEPVPHQIEKLVLKAKEYLYSPDERRK